MKTEQELKSKCTPDFIKWMCELVKASGFLVDYNIVEQHKYYDRLFFPLLIHRAVEGWNKKSVSVKIVIYPESVNISKELYYDDGTFDKEFYCRQYQPQSLTHGECASLACLLDRFEREKK